jgi:hypothetical protein
VRARFAVSMPYCAPLRCGLTGFAPPRAVGESDAIMLASATRLVCSGLGLDTRSSTTFQTRAAPHPDSCVCCSLSHDARHFVLGAPRGPLPLPVALSWRSPRFRD